MTVEATLAYDLLPEIEEAAYWEFIKSKVPVILRAQGLLEIRAHRNALGSPGVRITTVWRDLASWTRFTESEQGQSIQNGLRTYAGTLRAEVWAPSPYLAEPIRAIDT